MYNLIVILGPTATGKTGLAANVAHALNTEVISADSRQVYRGMDIGTGKDLADFIVEGKNVKYHLIDIVDAGYKYNIFEYQRDFLNAFKSISDCGKIPVLCGGSGLYIESVLKGYRLPEVPVDSELRATLSNKSLDELSAILSSMKRLHNVSEVDTVKRAIRAIEIETFLQNEKLADANYPEIKPILFGIKFERHEQRRRVTERLHQRLSEGMLGEVESLLKSGVDYDTLIYYGLEYKFIAQYLKGQCSYGEMVRLLEIAIHQFLKRQDTWFRRMEKNGFNINWIDGHLPLAEKVKVVLSALV